MNICIINTVTLYVHGWLVIYCGDSIIYHIVGIFWRRNLAGTILYGDKLLLGKKFSLECIFDET